MKIQFTNKIARNTIYLYFRMLITMAVSLYTVRVVLYTLGVVDYGIYNVVGSIVVMFSFISNTMASASQRFFSHDLGSNNIGQLSNTFNLSVAIYLFIVIIIFIFAETIGLPFLKNNIIIPENRFKEAIFVYQLSVVAFIVSVITIPYNALIIAHENMSVYAYISILEVILKLLSVYALVFFSSNKLMLYAVLTTITTLITASLFIGICKHKYKESRYQFYWNKDLFISLISYSGWNLFGAVAGVANNQGVNILLNIFFGPVVNAARAIAYQINAAINQFVLNFIIAAQPQIIKSYAAGEKRKMMSVVFQSSKISYFLLFWISLPILFETEFILNLWLKETPNYAILFARLVIISALIDSLSYPLITAAQASGKIMRYQIVVGSMLLLNLPLSYVFLKTGFQPQSSFYVAIVISLICLFLRLWMLRGLISLSMTQYAKIVLMRVVNVSIVCIIFPLLLSSTLEKGFIRFVVVVIASIIASFIGIYYVGLTKLDKYLIKRHLRKRCSSVIARGCLRLSGR